eukprot:CAMPEP_0117449680 /NCGR_PEP_ID=MMETSP0759-20121206/8069_1 /TAXON_ID=63605 /ORGANISM="Percolomonas cosmopolitus, Strain WS" /LENGTH=1763 /DNA_ID=CAMNT_0005242161 /DNA_START=413 /DNA_END=5704 /DNA_ORIENTATION=-
MSDRTKKRKPPPVKPMPLEERKKKLREVQEELKDHKALSSQNMSQVDDGRLEDSGAPTRREIAPSLAKMGDESLNLSGYLKHVEQLKDVLDDRSFDSSVDDHSNQMQTLVRKMRRSLNKISDVRESFQSAVSMGMETINMRKKIQELEGEVFNVEQEKERVISSQQVLSASMRENEKVMVGAMKREDMIMSKMRARVSELEFITKKQQETMQMVLKIAQYKEISFENISQIHENICHSFDVFRQTARGSDQKVLERLNKMHQDFLLETIHADGQGQSDPASDLELIKIILRNTRNTHEATQWIDDRIKQNQLENQVRTVLDQAKANNRRIKKSQQLQKQPTFLKEIGEQQQQEAELPSPGTNQRQKIVTPRASIAPLSLLQPDPAKTTQASPTTKNISPSAPEIEVFPDSSRSSATRNAPTLSKKTTKKTREYIQLKQFPPKPLHKNSPKLQKRASLPAKTLQDMIKDAQQCHETEPLKRSNSFTTMDLTNRPTLKKKLSLKALLRDTQNYKNVSVRDLVDRQAELIIDLKDIAKRTWSVEEWQNDLDQERDILERAKTLSMYYRERERAARNEKELEAEQIAVLKDLEMLEKKRLEHALKVKGRTARVIDRDQRCVMFLIVEGYRELIHKDPFSMNKAIETYERNVKTLCNVHIGDLFKNQKEVMGITFRDLHQCISFAIDLQMRLNEAHWPKQLLKQRAAKQIKDEDGEIIFCGLRIKMGINIGSPLITSNDLGRLQYLGPSVDRALKIAEIACGGEIIIGSPVYPHLRKWDLEEDFQTKVEVQLKGIEMIGDKAIRIPETLRALMPFELRNRMSVYESSSTVNTKGRALDLYPLIEALIQSASNAEVSSDREEILEVIRAVFVQCAKVLKEFTKETQYAEILNKMYKFKQLLKKTRTHRRNINHLRDRVNQFRDEFMAYGGQIMGVLNEFVSSLSAQEKTRYDWRVLQRNISQRETLLNAIEEKMFSPSKEITDESSSSDVQLKSEKSQLVTLKSLLKEKQEELARELDRRVRSDEGSKLCQTEPVIITVRDVSNEKDEATQTSESSCGSSTSSMSVQTILVLGGLTENESGLFQKSPSKGKKSKRRLKSDTDESRTDSTMLSSRATPNHSDSSGILEIKRSPLVTANDLKKPAPQRKERVKRKEDVNFDPVMKKTRSFKRGKLKRDKSRSNSSSHNVSARKLGERIDEHAEEMLESSRDDKEGKFMTEALQKDEETAQSAIATDDTSADTAIQAKTQKRMTAAQKNRRQPRKNSSGLLNQALTARSDQSSESVDAQLDSLRQSMSSVLDASKASENEVFESIIIKRVHLKNSWAQTDIPSSTVEQGVSTSAAPPTRHPPAVYKSAEVERSPLQTKKTFGSGIETSIEGSLSQNVRKKSAGDFHTVVSAERPPTEYEKQFLPSHLVILAEDFPSDSAHVLQQRWRELLCSKKREDKTEVQVIMVRARNLERRRSEPEEEHEDTASNSASETDDENSTQGDVIRPSNNQATVNGAATSTTLPSLFAPQHANQQQAPMHMQQIAVPAEQRYQQQYAHYQVPANVNEEHPPTSHDPYFAKMRSAYLKHIKKNATDMKQKYETLVNREQLVRKHEKQLRALFKQFNSFIKASTLAEGAFGGNPALEPLFSEGITLPHIARNRSPLKQAHTSEADNALFQKDHPSSRYMPRHAGMHARQGWHNLRHHLMQFSKELSESTPNESSHTLFYVNGNAWLDSIQLDPKGMVDLVPPFQLKSHQAFGPSSLNNASKWDYAAVLEQHHRGQ